MQCLTFLSPRQADSCHLRSSHALHSLLLRQGLDKDVKSGMDWREWIAWDMQLSKLYTKEPRKLFVGHTSCSHEKGSKDFFFSRPLSFMESSLWLSPFIPCHQVLNAPIPFLGCPKLLFLFGVGTSNDAHTISYSQNASVLHANQIPALG